MVDEEEPDGDEQHGQAGSGYSLGPFSAPSASSAGEVTVVRVRCYFAADPPVPTKAPKGWRVVSSGSPYRLIVEQQVAHVRGIEAARLGAPAQRREAKQELLDAVAKYFADSATNSLAPPLTRRWQTQPLPYDPAVIGGVLDRCEGGLHNLVAKPLLAAAGPAGGTTPQITAAAGMTAEFVTAPVSRVLDQGSWIADIAGVAIGAATGMPSVVVHSVTNLAHKALADQVTNVFRRVLSGDTRTAPPPAPATPPTFPAPPSESAPRPRWPQPPWPEQPPLPPTEPRPPRPRQPAPPPSPGGGPRGPSPGRPGPRRF